MQINRRTIEFRNYLKYKSQFKAWNDNVIMNTHIIIVILNATMCIFITVTENLYVPFDYDQR